MRFVAVDLQVDYKGSTEKILTVFSKHCQLLLVSSTPECKNENYTSADEFNANYHMWSFILIEKE